LVYYMLMHVLVTAAGEKKAHWASLDARLDHYSPPPRRSSKDAPLDEPPKKRGTLMKKMTLFDEDVVKFSSIRDYIVEHLLDEDSPLRAEVMQLRDPPSQDMIANFRLSWYFRVNIDECIVTLVTTGTRTWVFLFLLFTGLGAGAAWWGWTYLHMMMGIGLMCTMVLGTMYYLSRKQFNHLHDMIDAPRGTRQMHMPNIRTETLLEAMRCGTLLLIYGAVQFIGSAFVWKYYFYANLLFCVFVAGALLVWCMSWVQIIPVYAAANALGPFSDPGMAKLHAANVRAALQDDAEWEAAESEAVKGAIASPRPPPDSGRTSGSPDFVSPRS